MLFAPLKGWRHVEVTGQRTAVDYAKIPCDLSGLHFPKAEKIVLVQDNLNTHTQDPFYEAFEPAESRRLIERFQSPAEMLDGTRRSGDQQELWEPITRIAAEAHRCWCQIMSTQSSADGQHVAAGVEHRTMLGFCAQHVSFRYSIHDRAIAGRISPGKRTGMGWMKTKA